MEQILESIDQFDKDLLLYLIGYRSELLDIIMAEITQKYNWIPLYLLLLIILYRSFGWQALYSMAVVFLLVTVSDQLTSSVMKPWIGRLRPCHDPEIGHLIQIITRCGGEYGFVSSHAANSFSVTTFFILLYRRTSGYVWLLLVWPFLFSYSRIYLGVHYPLDILGGALVGIFLGYLAYKGTGKLSTMIPFVFTPETKQSQGN